MVKRLRPIVTWMMGINAYGLTSQRLYHCESLEYMHTASLFFDDLPSQDNASSRRGRSTLHDGLQRCDRRVNWPFLTQKAFEEQTSLDQFDSKMVLA